MAVVRQTSTGALPWLSVTLAGLTAGLFAAFGPAPEAWVYDRAAIAGGEWWRLISGHWVHSDGVHLGWNLAAQLVLAWIVEMHSRRGLLAGLLVGTLGVDLMLWLGLPGLAAYCGLSGVLNSLVLLALAGLWQGATAPALVATGTLSLLKIVGEMSAGQALFTQTAWASVPEAHLAGWLAGLILIAARIIWGRRKNLAVACPKPKSAGGSSYPDPNLLKFCNARSSPSASNGSGSINSSRERPSPGAEMIDQSSWFTPIQPRSVRNKPFLRSTFRSPTKASNTSEGQAAGCRMIHPARR